MFKLTEAELDNAHGALNHHGYSALLPTPPEWDTVNANWPEFRSRLSNIDLDEYRPHAPLRVYAPKSRINIRAVALLHPEDLLLYTAMTLVARNDIERQRLAPRTGRVFSFRSDPSVLNQLYQAEGSHDRYISTLKLKAEKAKNRFIAVADIADFYQRVYHHPLENMIRAAAQSERVAEISRVLVKKFLLNTSGGNSYGIPVGPLASRVLAEGLLVDVDGALMGESIDFVRWVDDFNIFCQTEGEAQRALFFLGEWLFDKHGLTLQPAKTRIMPNESYVARLENDYEVRLAEKSELSRAWLEYLKTSEYSDSHAVVTEELEGLEADNLREMFEEALRNTDAVDYELAEFVLGRIGSLGSVPDEKKRALVHVVLQNVEHLYPIAASISKFFLSFSTLSVIEKRRIAQALLRPIRRGGRSAPPAFYCMWILNIFAQSPTWNNADTIVSIYSATTSQVVRRYAALALAATGERRHALVVKADIGNAAPMVQTAILLCSRKLGPDERKHWRAQAGMTGLLEKKL